MNISSQGHHSALYSLRKPGCMPDTSPSSRSLPLILVDFSVQRPSSSLPKPRPSHQRIFPNLLTGFPAPTLLRANCGLSHPPVLCWNSNSQIDCIGRERALSEFVKANWGYGAGPQCDRIAVLLKSGGATRLPLSMHTHGRPREGTAARQDRRSHGNRPDSTSTLDFPAPGLKMDTFAVPASQPVAFS